MRNLKYILILLMLLSGATLAQEPMDVNIVINGQALDKEPPPLKMAGQVMLPLRKVFNALGAEVRYENKIITATRGNKEVIMSPNVKEAMIDGQEIELAVPPMVFEGATYVPLRFVAQALGDSVAFDSATNTITVGPAEDPIDVPPDRITILKDRLKQLVVGNQGAILKVRDISGSTEIYYRGLDDRDTAPYSGEDQTQILSVTALGSDMTGWLADSMEAFTLLPKREVVAFLGLVYSIPNDSPQDPGKQVDDQIEEFLIQVVAEHPDVVIRRQAVLSMAVGQDVDPEIVEAVLRLYETSENLWETFPVQQFFQYHADELRNWPNFNSIRARVAAVNSLYTANILSYLDGN
ncbi:MAG: copper amine oxidase N-terminal domain-containing protein [Candidatus Eremiobacteraeota bacterium]|nr:copper amine oxidase N-terminal domain-containing protein [Candidatus Eremiobacteraeota bacterium]